MNGKILAIVLLSSIYSGFAMHAGDKPEIFAPNASSQHTIKYEFENLHDVRTVTVKGRTIEVLVLAASNPGVRVSMPVHTKDQKAFVVQYIKYIEASNNYDNPDVMLLTLLPKKRSAL